MKKFKAIPIGDQIFEVIIILKLDSWATCICTNNDKIITLFDKYLYSREQNTLKKYM